MKAQLVKFYFSLLDLIGRTFIFNTNMPSVGNFIPDLVYGEDDREKQSMDVVVPKGEGPFPILIYTHGGGWLSGNKKNYRRICHSFAAAGYLVFNLNYRLAPRHPFPTPLQDVAVAVRWILGHAGQYGGDVSRIFLSGDSAGAHLSMLMTASSVYPQLFAEEGISEVIPLESIKGLLLFYGAYDLEAVKSSFPFARTMLRSLLGPKTDIRSDLAGLLSPVNHVSHNFPPIFLCSGEPDPLHPQTLTFAEACGREGVHLEPLFFSRKEHPEAFHAFLNYYFLNCSKIALHKALTFMLLHSSLPEEESASAG